MAENVNMEEAVDRALGQLAEEMDAGTPRPGTDLVARVLADAAAVAPPPVADHAGHAAAARPRGVLDMLFGWTSGAVATLALCLSVGIAVGMEMDAGEMPMTEAPEESVLAENDGLFAQDDGLL